MAQYKHLSLNERRSIWELLSENVSLKKKLQKYYIEAVQPLKRRYIVMQKRNERVLSDKLLIIARIDFHAQDTDSVKKMIAAKRPIIMVSIRYMEHSLFLSD